MNQVAEIQHSILLSKCCGISKTVDVLMSLNRPGFIPGERIEIAGEIANNSGEEIKKVNLSLNQVIID